MAEVNLTIDGKNYGIACDDGQERRVQQLGTYVEQRLRQVSGGASGNKAQAMVLASIVLADEVFDLNEKLQKASSESDAVKQELARVAAAPAVSSSGQVAEYHGLEPKDEQNIVNIIGQMAAKVEKLTARVQKKSA